MKKSIFLAVLLAAIGASASDSYLYWMVTTTGTKGADSFDYNYARIKAVDGGTETYLSIYEADFDQPLEVGGVSGVSKSTVDDYAGFGSSAGFYASLAGINLSTASFIVELYNDDGKFLAQSFNDGSYGTVSGMIYNGGISIPPAMPWKAGSFDIPEPSSGLLMLLGMAGLALRRKKVA